MRRALPTDSRTGSLLVISAPSGSGKSTLVKRLLATVPGLIFSVSYTTRPRRAGERDGRDYFFVSEARFKRLAAAGDFAEWAQVHGYYYGTSRRQIRRAQAAGQDVLLDIDVQGHGQVRRRLPDAVSVFLLPPSFRELQRRLRRRHSDSPQVIRRRLRVAKREIRRWREYDYVVVNDRLERAAGALRSIVEAVRVRGTVQQEHVKKILKTFGGSNT
jgi:guanylate kinase